MNFVKSITQKNNFIEEEQVGDVTFIRFKDSETDDTISYYEACIQSNSYNKEQAQKEFDSYISKVNTNKLKEAINSKKNEILDYDSEQGADKVNNFYFEYNGQKYPYWFNAYERTALTSEATQWAKKYGTYRIDARKYGISFEINCDTLIEWLGQLKDYAIKCYNKTTDHLLAVSALKTVEDVNAYNYKEGYPENLVFKIETTA